MYQFKIVHRVDKQIPSNRQEELKKLAVNSSIFWCICDWSPQMLFLFWLIVP